VSAGQAIKRVKSQRLSTADAVASLQNRGFVVSRQALAPGGTLEGVSGLEPSKVGANNGVPGEQSQQVRAGADIPAEEAGPVLESTIYSRERGTLPEFVPLSKSKSGTRRVARNKWAPRSQSVDFLRESIRREDEQGEGDPNHQRWQASLVCVQMAGR